MRKAKAFLEVGLSIVNIFMLPDKFIFSIIILFHRIKGLILNPHFNNSIQNSSNSVDNKRYHLSRLFFFFFKFIILALIQASCIIQTLVVGKRQPICSEIFSKLHNL